MNMLTHKMLFQSQVWYKKFIILLPAIFLLAALLTLPAQAAEPQHLPAAYPAAPDATNVCGNITSNTTWSAANSPYVLTCNVTVNSGVALTIDPGVIVKSVYYSELRIVGSMTVNGTESQPVYFTSYQDDSVGGDTNGDGSATSPALGDWMAIFVESSGSLDMTFTTVRYAGGYYGNPYYNAGNVYVLGGGVDLDHVTLEQSAGPGLQAVSQADVRLADSLVQNNNTNGIQFTNIITPVITNTQILTNTGVAISMGRTTNYPLDARQVYDNSASGNGTNGMRFAGTLTGDSYLVPPGFPIVNEGITVLSGATLTIDPGVIVKSVYYSELRIVGSMTVNGTESQPVYFTSYQDDSVGGDTNGDGSATSPALGDWMAIFVESSGSLDMTFTTVRYAGGYYGNPYYNAGNVYVLGGGVDLDHVTLEQSAGPGLQAVSQADVRLADSLVQNNNTNGIHFTNIITPVITNTQILTNTGVAIYMGRTNNYPLDTRQVYDNSASGNGTNGMRFAGTLTGDSYLVPPGFPIVNEGITVLSGATLTIDPGVIVKSVSGYELRIAGSMMVNGTEIQPEYFTSLNDDSLGGDTNGNGSANSPAQGDWYAIFVESSGSLSMTFTTVRYAGANYGSPYYNAGNMYVQGGAADLSHVTLENCAGPGLQASSLAVVRLADSLVQNNNTNGIQLTDIVTPVITNTQILTNTGVAIYMGRTNNYPLDTRQVYDNSASGNGTNGMRFAGTLTEDSYLTTPGFPIVNEGITLDTSATLTIDPGVIVKSVSGYDMHVRGSMIVNGSESQPVYFTSLKDDSVGGDTNGDGSATSPALGDWMSIWLESSGSLSMTHTTVRYAGANYGSPYYNAGNVYVQGGAADLSHVTLEHSGGPGLQAVSQAAVRLADGLVQNNNSFGIQLTNIITPVITNTQILTNTNYAIYMGRTINNPLDTRQVYDNSASGNSINGMRFAGTLTGDSYFVNSGIPFVLGGVALAVDSSLDIGEGFIAKFLPGSDLQVSGEVTATGTLTNPVIFTSYKNDNAGGDTNGDHSSSTPAAGDWLSIMINSSGRAYFRHIIASYGGESYGSPHYNKGNIWVNTGTLDMENSTSEFGLYGVNVNNGHAVIHYSNLENNTSYGVYNYPGWTERVNATWNWWGDHSGPQLMGINEPEVAVNVSDGVDYEPYNHQWIVDEPVVGFSADSDAPTKIGMTTHFTATVSSGTNPQFLWDFGDGITLTGATPSHTYTSVNTYTVVVTASNTANWITSTFQLGVTDSEIEGLALQTSSPTDIGDTTYFTTTITSGSNVSYAWDFGDGGKANGATSSHTYASLGDYTVVVTASNTSGWVTSTVQTSVIDSLIQGLAMQTSSPTDIGETTYFTASLSHGSNVTFDWDFGDGSSGSGVTTSHLFATAGVYTVTLTATNTRGSDSVDQLVQVGDTQIVGLTAEVDGQANANQPTTFTASVTSGSGITYEWDFGDGQTGSGASVEHTFTSPGIYHVVLTASNTTDTKTYEFDVIVYTSVFLPMTIR